MFAHNFFKARLIYQVSENISAKKMLLLQQLIEQCRIDANFNKIIDKLKILNEYEINFFNKINNFISTSRDDFDILHQIKKEIEQIATSND